MCTPTPYIPTLLPWVFQRRDCRQHSCAECCYTRGHRPRSYVFLTIVCHCTAVSPDKPHRAEGRRTRKAAQNPKITMKDFEWRYENLEKQPSTASRRQIAQKWGCQYSAHNQHLVKYWHFIISRLLSFRHAIAIFSPRECYLFAARLLSHPIVQRRWNGQKSDFTSCKSALFRIIDSYPWAFHGPKHDISIHHRWIGK